MSPATSAAATCNARSPKALDVLAEDDWNELLTAEDRRGLTPLFWQHVQPYGEVKLDMTARLTIRTAETSGAS
ncbi:MAG: transposase [Streptosporangiales bacterium]|nr:transposase [Streptosporangiales bacterium]